MVLWHFKGASHLALGRNTSGFYPMLINGVELEGWCTCSAWCSASTPTLYLASSRILLGDDTVPRSLARLLEVTC